MRTWKPDPTSRRTTPRPKGWKAIRARILRRDQHRCTWITTLPDGGNPRAQGASDHPDRCTQGGVDVDHIGEPDDHGDSNLRALCEEHHDHRTGTQAAAKRWSNQAARRQRAPQRHPGLR